MAPVGMQGGAESPLDSICLSESDKMAVLTLIREEVRAGLTHNLAPSGCGQFGAVKGGWSGERQVVPVGLIHRRRSRAESFPPNMCSAPHPRAVTAPSRDSKVYTPQWERNCAEEKRGVAWSVSRDSLGPHSQSSSAPLCIVTAAAVGEREERAVVAARGVGPARPGPREWAGGCRGRSVI